MLHNACTYLRKKGGKILKKSHLLFYFLKDFKLFFLSVWFSLNNFMMLFKDVCIVHRRKWIMFHVYNKKKSLKIPFVQCLVIAAGCRYFFFDDGKNIFGWQWWFWSSWTSCMLEVCSFLENKYMQKGPCAYV